MSEEQKGWIIERYCNSVLEYWNGMYDDERGWDRNNAKAIRFAREVDAAVVLSWILKGMGRVAQHAWVG